MASEGCLLNLILRKFPFSLLPQSGHRPQRPTHTKVLKDANPPSTLTSLWATAWAQGGQRPWREGLAWKGMRRSSDPRSLPFCAVAPSPSPPASRSLWGRSLPGHGWTVRTLRAPLRPGARCRLPAGGRGWERWMVGSEISSWWMPQLEVSGAHSSSLSGKTKLKSSGSVFLKCSVVSERGSTILSEI